MPSIVIDGSGIPKASLVAGAYEYCGLNDAEYERTPEEISTGMRHLNAVMARLLARGIDLGFDFPTYGVGLPEAPSGIPDSAQEAVMALLAQRLAPSIGATLSAECRAVLATAMQDLYTGTAAAPVSMLTSSRIPSSGVRHRNFLAAGTATATDTAV